MKLETVEEIIDEIEVSKKSRKAIVKLIDLKNQDSMDKILGAIDKLDHKLDTSIGALNTKLDTSLGALNERFDDFKWFIGKGITLATVVISLVSVIVGVIGFFIK